LLKKVNILPTQIVVFSLGKVTNVCSVNNASCLDWGMVLGRRLVVLKEGKLHGSVGGCFISVQCCKYVWSVTLVWAATKMKVVFEKPTWHVIKLSGQQLNSCLAAHQVGCGNTKV
jgi:hypothetical protein